MTLGFTGVVWLPRGATVNSTSLNAGVGPVALTAASAAWTALSAALTDATLTMTRVVAELGVGWEGLAADAALAKLVPFHAWTQEAGALAAVTASKAGAEATAHTVARLAMPSIAEIAAVKTAKVLAHTVGGPLVGAGAAAEAADRAMDVRAGLVMEAYEAASTAAASPQSFTPPPPLANGPRASGGDGPAAATAGSAFDDFRTAPAGAAVAAALAHAQNPAVVGAASQAGSIAGSGLGAAASTATSLAPNAVSALAGGVTGPGPGATGRGEGTGGRGEGGPRGGHGGPGSTATRGVGFSGRGYSGSAGHSGSAADADASGYSGGAASAGGSSQLGGGAAGGGTGAGTTPLPDALRPDQSRADTAAASARGGPVGAPMTGAARGAGEDELHHTPDYLRGFEHFGDGRVVIPSVIGADPDFSS